MERQCFKAIERIFCSTSLTVFFTGSGEKVPQWGGDDENIYVSAVN